MSDSFDASTQAVALPPQSTPGLETELLMQRSATVARRLAISRSRERSRGLHSMARSLSDAIDEILEANTLDLEACQDMAVPTLIKSWLKLTPERLEVAAQMLEDLADLSDPMQQIPQALQFPSVGQSYVQLIPLGVIALVSEAFPELVAIAAGLCLKTGNSLVVRGSSEASHSNVALVAALRLGLETAGLEEDAVLLLPTDEGSSLKQVVTQDQYLNLVIPYGRPSFVQQVIRQATAPVLRTGMGNCYLYWGATGRLDTVRRMILDSHQGQPDAVNAVEKVLVHRATNFSGLQMLWSELREKGFEVRAEAELVGQFAELTSVLDGEWGQPYLQRVVAFRWVDSLEEAIAWINTHSSGHADCIVTESYSESRLFALGVDSATAHINTSPRFYRNPKHGSDLALGMSNQKGHRRGRIGLETLTTVKQIILGSDD